MIDSARLESAADIVRRNYSTATPFPHAVLDDAIDGAALLQAWRDWPDRTAAWQPSQRNKWSMRDGLPESLAAIIRELNDPRFVAWLASVTGITDLLPDHTLGGAGLHETRSGGFLPLHVDFNRQGELYRRLNVLLFMNRGWDDSWMGSLELVDEPRKTKERIIISPRFNRLVIQESSDRSWHGHPHVLMCPLDTARRSIAVYYYSAVPHETFRVSHSTKYRVNQEQVAADKRRYHKQFTPPR